MQLQKTVNEFWNLKAQPALMEYIKIPAKSTAYDRLWQEHGFLEQCCELGQKWIQECLPQAQTEIIREEGRTPCLFVDIPATRDNSAESVVFYGHLDKQPEAGGWSEGLGPWTPVVKNGKLYGRGAADDGYSLFSMVTSVYALEKLNLAHPRVIGIFETQEEFQKPAYKFIGIVFNTYIIIEIEQEMYIIDQHAAHERIMYEKVKENYYSESSKDSQLLLLPDVITLTHKEMDIAKENIKMFEQAGFSLEEFGENTIKLTGVPTVCIDLDTKELFLETLDEINTVARTAKQEKEEKFIATVACKAAVKANMALTREEVESLMDKLLQLPNPFTCPHGRPTAIKMTKYDIERKFARK